MYGILAAVEYEDDIFYSHPQKNGLYNLNKKTKKIRYIASFDWESFEVQGLYKRAVCIQDHILFFPANAKMLAVYDIKNDLLYPYECKSEMKYKQMFRCHAVLTYKKYIWVWGNDGSDRILKICNKDDNNYVAEDMALHKVFYNEKLVQNEVIGIKSISVDSRIIYISGADHNILSYDLKSGEYSVYYVEDGLLSALVGIDDNERIWFALRGMSGIGYLDLASGIITVLNDYPIGFDCVSTGQPFMSIHFLNGKAIFIPARANAVVSVDMQTNEIEIIKKVNEIVKCFDAEKDYFPFLFVYEGEKEIVAVTNNADGAVMINKMDFSTRYLAVFDGIDMAYTENLEKKARIMKILIEDESQTLQDYLKF